MEDDEPNVSYEVAWVDNGSGPSAASLAAAWGTGLEHVKISNENHGLAWGLNQLFEGQCSAPHVLILEEDWLFMDASVAVQTAERKAAVGRALEVARSGAKSFDGRKVTNNNTKKRERARQVFTMLRQQSLWGYSRAFLPQQRLASMSLRRCTAPFCGRRHTTPSSSRHTPARGSGRLPRPRTPAVSSSGSTAPI